MLLCPQCGSQALDPLSKYCEQCNHELPGMPRCPSCGAPGPVGAEYCAQCGSWFPEHGPAHDERPETDQAVSEKPEMLPWPLSLKIALILALIGMASIYASGLSVTQFIGQPARSKATLAATCTDVDIQWFLRKAIPVNDSFNPLVKLAASTPRVSLVGVVREMQDVHREYASLRVWAPECVEVYHRHTSKSMELTIDGFLAFMAQDEDEASNYFEQATKYLNWASDSLDNALARAK